MKKVNTDNKEYMTFEEAIEFTKMSKDAFKRTFCGEDNKFKTIDGQCKIARSVLEDYAESGHEPSDEERKLLDKLESGELDGPVGDEFIGANGNTSRMVIEHGVPRRYRRKAGCYYSEHYDEMRAYDETLKKEWPTDCEKLAFLAKYGFLFDDEDVRRYNQERMSDDEW